MCRPPILEGGIFFKNLVWLVVGNAVPGVPQVLCTCKPYRIAAFGGRNAEDGVPYGLLQTEKGPRRKPGAKVLMKGDYTPK